MPHDVVAALLALAQSGEGIPLHVKISPDDEIVALRKQIEELQAELKLWREKFDRCEFLFVSECQVTQQLIQVLQDNDIRIPRGLRKR